MTPQTWAGIIALLLTGGVGVAAIEWLKDWAKDRRQGPITTRDAHVAAADTLQEMSLRAATDANARAEAAHARLERLESARRTDSERIASLERHSAEQDGAIERLQRTVGRWVRWYADLVDRWDHVRAQSHPPPAPDDDERRP